MLYWTQRQSLRLSQIPHTGGHSDVHSKIRAFRGRQWSQQPRAVLWQAAAEQWFPSDRSRAQAHELRDPSRRQASPRFAFARHVASPDVVCGDVEGREGANPVNQMVSNGWESNERRGSSL